MTQAERDQRQAASAEATAFARDLDRPKLGPNPVPDKHVSQMSLTEQELFEKWAGIPISAAERNRRQRLRNEHAERNQEI